MHQKDVMGSEGIRDDGNSFPGTVNDPKERARRNEVGVVNHFSTKRTQRFGVADCEVGVHTI